MSRKLFPHFLSFDEATIEINFNWLFPILTFPFATGYMFPIFAGHMLAKLPLSELAFITCLAIISKH